MSTHARSHEIGYTVLATHDLELEYSTAVTILGCLAHSKWVMLSEQQVDTSKPNYLVLYRKMAAKEPEPLPVINAVRERALNPRIHRNAIGRKK
jgi:hypothetical protein